MASLAHAVSPFVTAPHSAAVSFERSSDAQRMESAAFEHAIIALAAKLAGVDGVPSKAEYAAFQALFVEGEGAKAAHARSIFISRVGDSSPALQYARQIASMTAGQREWHLDLLRKLVQVAVADAALNAAELELLRAVADILTVDRSAFRALIAETMAMPGASPYQVLGVSHRLTDEALRVHYMALVQKLHPDRYHAAGASAETIAMLSGQLAAVNAAYQTIQKQRGKKSARSQTPATGGWWTRFYAKGARVD